MTSLSSQLHAFELGLARREHNADLWRLTLARWSGIPSRIASAQAAADASKARLDAASEAFLSDTAAWDEYRAAHQF